MHYVWTLAILSPPWVVFDHPVGQSITDTVNPGGISTKHRDLKKKNASSAIQCRTDVVFMRTVSEALRFGSKERRKGKARW